MSGLNTKKQLIEDADERNFNLDVLGGFFDYKPKHSRKVIDTLEIKNQLNVNTCVTCAKCSQKEPDEGEILSVADLTSYLVNKGVMNSGGTTLKAALTAEVNRGIAEETVVPTNQSDWSDVSGVKNLTQVGKENAAIHKSKSYWNTRNINTILEQLDNDRIGLTGAYWYSGYTGNGILSPKSGTLIFGHGFIEVGYDLNYKGFKCIIFQNSYGKEWGDKGLFYVKFEEYNQVINFSSYFVLDIPKDIASWLSLNAGKVIKEKKGNKCYAIVGNEKKHIQNEAILLMLGYTFSDIVDDKDNMLPSLKTGENLTIQDIPETEQKLWKEVVKVMPYPAIQEIFNKTLNML